MKAMVLTGIDQIRIVDKPVPDIRKPDDVLIRMASVGICGSDIHYYHEGKIGTQVVQYPFTIGHEGAGIIHKTGSAVTRVKPGDRVAIDPAMPCYQCDQCKAGRFHTCRNLLFLGCPGQAEGCLSEYLVMPAASCHPLKDNVTLDQGALSEPLAIGVYATNLSVLLKGATVGILGSGPIGISVLLSALEMGAARVYMTDLLEPRLSLAAEMGATWTGNPETSDVVKNILKQEPLHLDVVFECCGKQEAADQAIQLLKPGGQLMIVGIPSFMRWSFDVENLRRKEIDIRHVRRQNEMVTKTIDLISSGRIKPDRMQTHTFRFEQIREAFEMVAGYKDGVMKALIHF
jgi:L-iditol 2-dehydrogenase